MSKQVVIWLIKSILPGIFFLFFAKTIYAQDYRSNSSRHTETIDTSGEAEGDLHSRTIYGTVRSSIDNEYIGLALISELGVSNMVYTTSKGTFSIKLDLTKPVKLVCSYLGFESDTVIATDKSSYINFRLKQNYVVMTEVIVTGSRKPERKFESAVTVETLDPKQIQYNPSGSTYDRIANMAGVDAITTSLNYKVYNTRGFNSAYNRRFIQRFDNMDLAMPGFSTALVQLNGPIDLDIEKTELIAGAASALYGPNALSGLLNTTAKNPFQYKGLSVNLKTGMNHVDAIDAPASPLIDFSFRYANTISKKWAYKVVMNYMKGNDWRAKDYSDIADYSSSKNNSVYNYKIGAGNPGYDAVNMGGDEVYSVFDSKYRFPNVVANKLKDPLRVARTGYKEENLFDYNIYSLKWDGGLYYRPNKHTEISLLSRVGSGSANFQTENRTQIVDFLLQMHKFEVKVHNHVFRSYASLENTGTSYDFSTTAIKMNQSTKSDKNWFDQYLLAYTGQYNNISNIYGFAHPAIQAWNDSAARKFADGDNSKISKDYQNKFGDKILTDMMTGGARLIPGTKAYDSTLEYVTNHYLNNNGSEFISRSKIWYSEYIYDFKDVFKKFSLMIGGNYRLFAPRTFGSLLSDTAGSRIYSNELGAFIQVGKDFFNKRLKLQASARVDKLQRFDSRMSPRASAVWILGKQKQQNIRLSAQIGYRMPTLYDQFNNIRVPLVRNFGAFYQTAVDAHLIRQQPNKPDFVNLYTLSSANQFLLSGDSSLLVKPNLVDLKPEEIRAIELGWRGFTFNKLETDVVLYFNRYQNLIATQQYIGPKQLMKDTISAAMIQTPSQTIIYRRSGNSAVPVNAYGASVSANYYYNKKITFFGNYSFNKLQEIEEYFAQDNVDKYNTPNNKFNLGFTGIKIFKNLGFSAIYKWVQSYEYSEFTKKGTVPAYYNIDLAFTYHLAQKYHTLLKMGGSNITNVRYVQSIGGPTIGAVFYFSILYDDLLK